MPRLHLLSKGRERRWNSTELPRLRVPPGDQGFRCCRGRHSGEQYRSMTPATGVIDDDLFEL